MNPKQKADRYERVYNQIHGLIKNETNLISKCATISAILHHKFPQFFWTGFYMLSGGELKVQNYQGPVACMVLAKHSGVCWKALDSKATVIVEDVHNFPGHIACDNRSKSEIVIPIIDSDDICHGVLDIDSKELATFDKTDQEWLEKIVGLL